MGQYYKIVNLDKKEYLHPHKFGDGLKLMEFGNSIQGTLLGLTALLADGNGRGSGDLHSNHPIIGTWAGDRIVIAGDYADGGKFVEGISKAEIETIVRKNVSDDVDVKCYIENFNLYSYAEHCFKDISAEVLKAIASELDQ